MGLVTLLSGGRVVVGGAAGVPDWLAAGAGFAVDATLCHVVSSVNAPLRCADLAADPQLASVAASRALGLRAYLGVPVRDALGRVVGTVCAADQAPRRWTDADADRLADLGALVEAELGRAVSVVPVATAEAPAVAAPGGVGVGPETLALETVGRLAYGVAHDFNNLLTVIGTSARFVRDAVADGLPPARAAEARGDLDEIDHALQRAGILSRQLLLFGRRGELGRPARLADVVRGVAELAERVVGSDVHVAARVDAAECAVAADPGHLERALLHLVVHARDAMPGGGVLHLAAREAAPEEATCAGLPEGRWAVLEVGDTGLGGDATAVADFGRTNVATAALSRTDVPGPALDAGLAAAHAVVARAGGQLRMRGDPARGTLVVLYLPQADATID